ECQQRHYEAGAHPRVVGVPGDQLEDSSSSVTDRNHGSLPWWKSHAPRSSPPPPARLEDLIKGPRRLAACAAAFALPAVASASDAHASKSLRAERAAKSMRAERVAKKSMRANEEVRTVRAAKKSMRANEEVRTVRAAKKSMRANEEVR